MAYNPVTGETVLNGRTYTPGGHGARYAFRTISHYADAIGFPASHDRAALISAVRMFYRLPLEAPALQIARSVIRGLRAEAATV